MEEHNSLGEKVFARLKSSILSGEYRDGAELRESTVAEKLGVSRTPVREAIRQLEKEGLVEVYPNRRAHVKGITFKDVEDIYQIRSRLEGLCAEKVVASITEERLSQLEEIIFLSKYYEQRNDVDRLVMMDGQFHELLYASCGSKILEHQLRDYHQYVKTARHNSLKRPERIRVSVKEHEEILEAIKRRDAKLADELARQHMLNAMESIRQGRNASEKETNSYGKD